MKWDSLRMWHFGNDRSQERFAGDHHDETEEGNNADPCGCITLCVLAELISAENDAERNDVFHRVRGMWIRVFVLTDLIVHFL